MTSEAGDLPQPTILITPYPGISPFTYLHGTENLFFEREEEAENIIDHIIAYRSVLLFAASGVGKSSLVNAAILPKLVKRGLSPEKIRLHPNLDQEFEIERISRQEGGRPPFLNSLLFPPNTEKTLLASIAAMDQKIRSICSSQKPSIEESNNSPSNLRPLLIFDQFEEAITRFDAQTLNSRAIVLKRQQSLFDTIQSWHDDKSLNLKMLFIFREEYLAQLNVLFRECRGLNDRQIRLRPLSNTQLKHIIRGPFEISLKGRFQPELDDSLASNIQGQFHTRYGDELPRPTELQIVCQSLYEQGTNSDLHQFFRDNGGVNGIVQNFYKKAIEQLPDEQRKVAVEVLTRLLTPDGTRDLVDAKTLLTRVKTETDFPEESIKETLNALEGKLIRREPRGNRFSYEVISEYLVPWIKEAREKQRVNEEQEKALAAETALKREEKLRHEAETQRAVAEHLQLEAATQKTRAYWGATAATVLAALVVGLWWFILSLQAARDYKAQTSLALETSKFFTQAKMSISYIPTPSSRISPERIIQAVQEAEKFALHFETEAKSIKPIDNSEIFPKKLNLDLPEDSLERSIVESIQYGKLNRTQIQRVLSVARAAKATVEYRTTPPHFKPLTADHGSKATAFAAANRPPWILSIAYHQKSHKIATGGALGVVKLWHIENNKIVLDKELLQVGINSAAIRSIAFSEDGNLVAVGAENGGIYRYRYDNDKYDPIAVPDRIPIDGIAFKHDLTNKNTIGLLIARRAPAPNHFKMVVDILAAPDVQLPREQESVDETTYTKDHRISLLGSGGLISDSAPDGLVTIYTIEKDAPPLITLKGHGSLVYRVASDQSGSRFATAGADGTARVWDRTGKELFRIHTTGDDVYNVDLSPDGALLSTTASNGIVETWNISSKLRLIYPMEQSLLPGYAVYIGSRESDGTAPMLSTSGSSFFFNQVSINHIIENNTENPSAYDCPGCAINEH